MEGFFRSRSNKVPLGDQQLTLARPHGLATLTWQPRIRENAKAWDEQSIDYEALLGMADDLVRYCRAFDGRPVELEQIGEVGPMNPPRPKNITGEDLLAEAMGDEIVSAWFKWIELMRLGEAEKKA